MTRRSDEPRRPAYPPVTRLGSLSVVLPCYNEEGAIRQVVTEVAEFVPTVADRFEIIAVNDGSLDRTGAILEEMAAEIPQLVVVHHDPNRGYGAALRTGFGRARLDYVFYTDSDGQFDISELPVLLPHTRDVDIVTGYRKHRRDPLHRKINAGLFKSFARIVLGIRLRDIDCAFKIYRREAIQSLDLRIDGILIDTEIFYRAKRKGYSVREVPVTHLPRTDGAATGNRLDVIFRVFRELPKLRHRH